MHEPWLEGAFDRVVEPWKAEREADRGGASLVKRQRTFEEQELVAMLKQAQRLSVFEQVCLDLII